MRKRLTSALLTLVLLLSLVPAMGTPAAAAGGAGSTTIGPDDAEVTITIKGVKAGELAQNVTYEVKYSDGTTGWPPYSPFDGVERKTPWQVKETGRYLLKNYIAYNGNTLADYDDHFYAGMTYTMVIAKNSLRYAEMDKVKLVFEDCGIVSTSGALKKVMIEGYTCYTLDVKIEGEMKTHGLKVDQSIDHVYKRLENGMYEEIPLTSRTLQIPEGTKLKFTVDKDCVSDGGVLKFFKGFQTEIVNPKYREYSSEDKAFIEGNFKVLSESGQEIILQMGDRDTSISAVFTDKQLVRLNAIYLDVLPAIENGRRVTVVTPSSEATRVAATPGLSSADRLATYTIIGQTAGEMNPNDNSVYLYEKTAQPNTKTGGNYTLDFSVKLNGNFYCSDRTTAIYINGKQVPKNDIALTTGFGNSDSLPLYWNIDNRKIEALGYTGWDMDFRLRDFTSQYYENTTGRYGLGLDDPMDFQKATDNNYRYSVSDGYNSKDVRAYGSFEAASGQACTVTFPVAVPESIRKWNANHSGEEQIGFTFREGATGGVFVEESGGAYVPVEATCQVSTPDSSGNVTASATFTPENGKKYRVMGNVAATWQGKIVANTPMDNSFIYVKGVAKQYLTGSVVYTSAVRYGDNVSIGRTGGLASIDTEKLHYQWQWKNGDTWTDISGATNGALPSAKVNSFVGQQIRVKVTADGYEGVIYSEAKEVGKATWDKTPIAPELFYDKIANTVTVNNLKNDQWYLISEKSKIEEIPSSARVWQRDRTFDNVVADKTYYVYTCMGETGTHRMGTIYRYSTIRTGDDVPLTGLMLEGYTNRIYVKKGEPLTINVAGTPANANQWNAIYFINQDSSSSAFTVKVDNGDTNNIPAGTGNLFGNHTITITATSGGTLVASSSETYSPYATNAGTWSVEVYEDTPSIDRVELIDPPTYADVTLSVGDSYTPENVNPTIQTIPAGVMENYDLKWFVMTPAASAVGTPTYSADNTYISVAADGNVTTKAANTAGENSIVALCAVDKTTGSFVRHIADYHVTVTDAAAPTLEKLSVGPSETTLTVGKTVTLMAVKYPANATGTISWESSNTGVATVDSSTGKVTAVAAGTTTITAKCGSLSAECKVYVITEGHTHSYGAWTYDDNFHYKTCTANDDMLAEQHKWEADNTKTNTDATLSAPGEHHYKCSVCGATKTEPLSQLTAITDAGVSVTAPAYGEAPSGAYASGSGFTVASVDWQPAVSGSFAANTVYTVKVVLESSGSSRFTNATQFTINGKAAAIVSTAPTAAGAETVTLTYAFPATGTTSAGGSGSSSSGGTTGSSSFPDVPSGAYYADAVKWAVDKKITSGTSATTFSPDNTCLRAQAVTFLWRAAGSPAPKSAAMPFTDVAKGSYYYDAVLWAVENSISKGTSDTAFSPNATCSRGQIMTFLWRSQKSPAAGSVNPFTDVTTNTYYADAVLWAVKENVTSGTSATAFSPNADCTRAQIVTFLYRALAK